MSLKTKRGICTECGKEKHFATKHLCDECYYEKQKGNWKTLRKFAYGHKLKLPIPFSHHTKSSKTSQQHEFDKEKVRAMRNEGCKENFHDVLKTLLPKTAEAYILGGEILVEREKELKKEIYDLRGGG